MTRPPIASRRLAFIIPTLLIAVSLSAADTVVTHDGKIYVGKIIKETPGSIVIEVDRYGAKMEQTVKRGQIRRVIRGEVKTARPVEDPKTPKPTTTVDKPVAGKTPTGPGYYQLPIRGWLGAHVKAETFRQAIEDLKTTKCEYVVVYIDSSGGSCPAAADIIDALAAARTELKDRKFLAFVRRARGSAAAVALSVPEIYMYRGGAIRAATAPNAPDDITVADAAEINGQIIAAAKAAGHAPLIARGLTEPDLALAVGVIEGTKTVTLGDTPKLLKKAGVPWALTANDAVACGLARGIAKNYRTLAVAAGPGQWRNVNGKGGTLLRREAAAYQQAQLDEKREADLAARKAAREAYLEKVAPKVAEIDAKIEELKTQGRTVEAELATLQNDYNQEVARANETYDRQINQLNRNGEGYAMLLARYKGRHRRDMLVIQQKYERLTAPVKSRINQLLGAIRTLERDRKKLVGNRPKPSALPAVLR